jgi:hypothetical protein
MVVAQDSHACAHVKSALSSCLPREILMAQDNVPVCKVGSQAVTRHMETTNARRVRRNADAP